MPRHEGMVQLVTGDGKAEVLICPKPPGIIGAPEVSKKVCHSATDGSNVRTAAFNEAGAREGDWVLVVHKPGVVLKNSLTLLVLPLAGGFLGFLAGFMVAGVGAAGAGMTFCTTAGVVAGIIVGGTLYRKTSHRNLPVITRVLQSREELTKTLGSKTKKDGSSRDGCDLCTQCFK
jgi:hypothetical protein